MYKKAELGTSEWSLLQVWGSLLSGLAVVLTGLVVVQVGYVRLYDQSVRCVNDIGETGVSKQQG